jgi:hypothetical protein
LRCAAPAFAMIRFREVRQLEVDREGFGHPVRLSDVETVDYLVGAIHQLALIAGGVIRSFAACVLLAAFNQQRSQFLNREKKFVPDLFLQHLTEQTTKRADVTTQRRFFQIAVVAYKLSQSRRLIAYFPEWFPFRHGLALQKQSS